MELSRKPLIEVPGFAQDERALLHLAFGPVHRSVLCGADRQVERHPPSAFRAAHDLPGCWRAKLEALPAIVHRNCGRLRSPACLAEPVPRGERLPEAIGIAQVDAARIHPRCTEQLGRLPYDRFCGGDGCEGVCHHRRCGHRTVGNHVNKAAIRAILEQTPHKIGKQVGMASNRRVDPGPGPVGLRQNLVQALAHSMQPLKFVAVERSALCLGDVQHSRCRMGVVGGELRIYAVPLPEEPPGIGDVAHVSRRLGRKDRKSLQTKHLRPLDLGVPVRALYQSHHHAPVEAIG